MKTIKKHVVLPVVLILLLAGLARAQVINVSTGINDNTGAFIPINTPDDTWSVSAQQANAGLPSTYFPVKCGTGALLPLMGGSGIYPNLDGSVQWLSTDLDPSGTSVLPNVDYGFYYYKTIFNLGFSCPLQSATLHFNTLYVDDQLNVIYVNGNPINVSYSLYNTNVDVNIPPGSLSQGQNTLVLEVQNNEYWTGMEINGSLNLQADDAIDYYLTDKDGNAKNTFCFGEDILIHGAGQRANGYTVAFYGLDLNNNLIPTYFQNTYYNGSPDGYSVPDHVSQYLTFNIGARYRAVLGVNSPCGQDVFNLDFKVQCCPTSTDPTFGVLSHSTLFMNTTQLTGTGNIHMGGQNWYIYGMTPSGNMESGTPIKTFTTNGFSMEATESCYLIKHSVGNNCGSGCTGRRVCNFDCGDKTCNLNPPANLNFFPSSKELTWNPVPGATYSIVLTLNDPLCCTVPGGLGPAPTIKTIPVASNDYILDYAQDLDIDNDGVTPCFSWKVIAQCPDGSTATSDLKCSGDRSGVGDPHNPSDPPHGRMFVVDGAAPGQKDDAAAGTTAKLFPNPTTGLVSIDIKTPADLGVAVDVLDATGQLVKTFGSMRTLQSRLILKWDAGSLNKGIYLVKISTADGKTITKTLTIE